VEESIHHNKEINVGVAVDSERGLLVPVVRSADSKSIIQINRELSQLLERALAGKSLLDDLTGGTFTITNLGSLGIDAFTPIINHPEAAILGVGRIVQKPVVVDGGIYVRDQVTLSLTFDHRLVDGAPAARFLQRIGELIETLSSESGLW
jgi:pyruvate dehydrogenase E2 component (dihydrolipoamide acetyltransferase)